MRATLGTRYLIRGVRFGRGARGCRFQRPAHGTGRYSRTGGRRRPMTQEQTSESAQFRPLETHGLSEPRLVELYYKMALSRAIDDRLWVLNRQGKVPFIVSGQGH